MLKFGLLKVRSMLMIWPYQHSTLVIFKIFNGTCLKSGPTKQVRQGSCTVWIYRGIAPTPSDRVIDFLVVKYAKWVHLLDFLSNILTQQRLLKPPQLCTKLFFLWEHRWLWCSLLFITCRHAMSIVPHQVCKVSASNHCQNDVAKLKQ